MKNLRVKSLQVFLRLLLVCGLGGTLFVGNCSSSQIQSVIVGVEAALNNLDEEQHDTIGEIIIEAIEEL